MRRLSPAVAIAFILIVAACGSSGAKVQTPQNVIAYLQKQIQTTVSFDPNRETADSSALTTSDNSLGYFTIFVFKKGVQPTDSDIGGTPVPEPGKVAWSGYSALGADLPNKGTYTLLKAYRPNLVLLYVVDAVKGRGHPTPPGGFRLLDETLASLTGTKQGIAAASATSTKPSTTTAGYSAASTSACFKQNGIRALPGSGSLGDAKLSSGNSVLLNFTKDKTDYLAAATIADAMGNGYAAGNVVITFTRKPSSADLDQLGKCLHSIAPVKVPDVSAGAGKGQPYREALKTSQEKAAYDEAFYECDPNESAKPRAQFVAAIASLYSGGNTDPYAIAAGVANGSASVASNAFERSARAKEIWTRACLDALGVKPSATPSSGTPDTKAMVLQLGDLPTGFSLSSGNYVSNAGAAKGDPHPKNYAKLGRIIGYDASYKKTGVSGLIQTDSSANIYKTAAGAHESLAETFTYADKTYKRVSVAMPIGDEARMYLYTVTKGAVKIDLYILLWRSGRVFESVFAGGWAGTVDPSTVVALGKKQQARAPQ